MKNFKTHKKAVVFYKEISNVKFPYFLKDQMLRAASSVALNLNEGAGKFSKKEQIRFYNIALGSLMECQSILELQSLENTRYFELANEIGRMIWGLIKSRE